MIAGPRTAASDGEAILVKKDSPLKQAAQLKGKSIAVAQGSSAHYQLVASLKKAGLTLKDVTVNYLQPADALAAFTRGQGGRLGGVGPVHLAGPATRPMPGC